MASASPWLRLYEGTTWGVCRGGEVQCWVCADELSEWFVISRNVRSIRFWASDTSSPDAYQLVHHGIRLTTDAGQTDAYLELILWLRPHVGRWISLEVET